MIHSPFFIRSVVTSSFRRLIIVQPQLFLAESLLTLLRNKRLFHEILPASDIVSSLPIASRPAGNRQVVERYFFIGGISYFKLMEDAKWIAHAFPTSKIIVLDESPRPGCGVVVDRIHVHGYLTLYDSQHDVFQCLKSVVQGNAALASSLKSILRIDPSRNVITCRDELRQTSPHILSDKEWICFQHIIRGYNLESLAPKLNIELRSVKNLQYRMMKKLDISKIVDLFRIAHQWGFTANDFYWQGDKN